MANAGEAQPAGGRRTWVGGLVVAAATFALLLATEPRLAIVWDEGFTLGREERVRLWLRALRDPAAFAAAWQPPSLLEELVQPDGRPAPRAADLNTRAGLFDRRVLEWFWPFAREEPHGHPPFYALVGLIGDLLAPSWDLLPRARLGPMIVFSLTAGAVYTFMARRLGTWPAAAAAAAFTLQPRLFAHAHYAHYDSLLTCLWVCALLAFTKAVEDEPRPRPQDADRTNPRWVWAVAFGLCAGAAAATKLTGWFLPLPFLAWTLLYRSRRGALTILAGGAVALVALYVLVPPWWGNPVDGIERFLRSNLTRSRTTKIPTLFLGHVVLTPRDSLPWYNTLVWTVFVTPAGFLALALVGTGATLRRARTHPVNTLPLFCWLFMLALRAMPHTPGHDGERQFLAAFGFLPLLAGHGAAALLHLGSGLRWPVAAAIGEGAVSVSLAMPVLLSYYSPLVGGLPGATRLGMEPTYYWDSVSAQALDWLNTHTHSGSKVLFPTYPTTWRYLRQTGRLKVGALPHEPGDWAWFVLQNRPGGFSPEESLLVASHGPEHVLVSQWGVPLLWAFPYAQLEQARAEVQARKRAEPGQAREDGAPVLDRRAIAGGR